MFYSPARGGPSAWEPPRLPAGACSEAPASPSCVLRAVFRVRYHCGSETFPKSLETKLEYLLKSASQWICWTSKRTCGFMTPPQSCAVVLWRASVWDWRRHRCLLRGKADLLHFYCGSRPLADDSFAVPSSGHLVSGVHHGRNDQRKNAFQRKGLYPVMSRVPVLALWGEMILLF